MRNGNKLKIWASLDDNWTTELGL